MKKPAVRIAACLFALSAFIPQALLAQFGGVGNDMYPRNIIKINPLSLFVGNISMYYERVIGPRTSFQLGVNYWSLNTGDVKVKIKSKEYELQTRWRGMGVTPEIRFYPFGEDGQAPHGVFLGGYMRYGLYNFTGTGPVKDANDSLDFNASIRLSRSTFGFGPIIGYQFIRMNGGLTVDIWGAVNLTFAKVKTKELSFGHTYDLVWPIILPSYSGAYPGVRAGVTLGYAF